MVVLDSYRKLARLVCWSLCLRCKDLGRAAWFKDKGLRCDCGRREESRGIHVMSVSQISGHFIIPSLGLSPWGQETAVKEEVHTELAQLKSV